MSFVHGLLAGAAVAILASGAVAAFAYRRLLRLSERARQAERLAELGRLTGGLAHEIKNPLSTIQLNLQLIQEDLTPGHPAHSRLSGRIGVCEKETARLREILDDFLRYAGRLELNRKPVDLNRLCEDLVDFMYPQAQLQKVRLRFQRAEGGLTVPADERLLKQAVLNLMINALQAMPGGGELILTVSRQGNQAAIDVIDTGSGIPRDILPHIFDAYYTTRRSGTGLGLAMTRRIAREHGGDVVVTSEEGKGSDFSLRVPLR